MIRLSSSAQELKFVLDNVPYYSQLDNGYASAYTCNSASCAMLAVAARPELLGKLGRENPDMGYFNKYIEPYGTSMDHANQTAALDFLGVKSEFVYDTSLDAVAQHVEQTSTPVAIAILHKGSLDLELPYGGHIIVVVGTVRDKATGQLLRLVCNDPNGELYVRSGGYSDTRNGERVEYSYENLSLRFETDSIGSYTPGKNGWARLLTSSLEAV